MKLSCQVQIEQRNQIVQKIEFLRSLLQRNRRVQAHLKNVKESTQNKIKQLEAESRSRKINLQQSISRNELGYINLIKHIPYPLKQQLALKNTNSRDFELMRQLSCGNKNKKAKKIVFSKLSEDPREIDFIGLAEKSAEFKNGLCLYRSWLQVKNQDKAEERPFSHNQECLLIEKYKKYRDNWDKICTFFDGRLFEELYYRFQNHSNKEFQKGRWTLSQNIKLIVLIEHFGEKKWATISKKIKEKSEIQVRERFCNILDPMLERNEWTKFQVETLIKEAENYKYVWSKLAQIPLFKGKTDNTLWRQFRSIMILKDEQEIERQVKDKALAAKLVQLKRKSRKKASKK